MDLYNEENAYARLDSIINEASSFKDKGDQLYLNEHFQEAIRFYQQTLEYLSMFDPDSYQSVKSLTTATLLSMANTY